MSEGFDAYEYFGYLVRRWPSVAITCGVAVAIALIVSLILPKRYQATSTVLIDPPAGSDVRTATAVSPVYLESLRTYEHFANSDSLFQRASERFRLTNQGSRASLESRKRRTLEVSKLRDTRILKITVTLEDPKTAQALAQYLAEETVRMSQSVLRESEDHAIDEARRQLEAARSRLDNEQKARRTFGSTAAIEGLNAEIESLTGLNTTIQRDALAADADLAEWSDRVKSLSTPDSDRNGSGLARATRELRATQARVAALHREKKATEARIRNKLAALATQMARKEQLETQLQEAATAYSTAEERFRELRAAAAFRGERLKIIDPGVVPERPVSPNLPLNLLAAFIGGLVVSLVHLSIRFGYARRGRDTWRDVPARIDR